MNNSLAMILTAERLDREARARAASAAIAETFHLPQATVEAAQEHEAIESEEEEAVELTEGEQIPVSSDPLDEPAATPTEEQVIADVHIAEESQPDVSTFDATEIGSLPVSDLSPADSAASESQSLVRDEPYGTDAEGFEQPDLPDELPDTSGNSAAELDDPEQPELAAVMSGPAGYQGGRVLPSVTQSAVNQADDSEVFTEDRANHQFELQRRASEDLASSLAKELGPMFDDLRTTQESVVRDYVAGQQLLTSILRVR